MKYSKFLWLVRKDMERRIRNFKETGTVLYFMCNAASNVARQDTNRDNHDRLVKDIRGLLGNRGSIGAWLTAAHEYKSTWQSIQFRRYFLRRLHKAALLEEKSNKRRNRNG